MGHQTPGSSQCQYWGELGYPTPLGDPTLQPRTPERGSAKLLLLSGRGRKGMGCWPTLLLPPGNTGTPTPFLSHRAGPRRIPLPSLAAIAPGGHQQWPQHSSAPLAGRAQRHRQAAETEEWLSLPAPE